MNIIDRFKNQRVSQLLHGQFRKNGSKPARVENCFRLKQKEAAFIGMKRKPGAKKAHYCGFQTCGSPWDCPVCSSLLSERRKIYLQNAIDIWRSKDPCNVVTMFTFTTPHYIFQSLDDVLSLQDKAIRIMQKQPQKGRYKVWRTIMEEIGFIGSFTGREITFGQNGWHPHRHTVAFCLFNSVADLVRAREDLTTAFAIACEKAGLSIGNMASFRDHAVQVDQITDDNGFDRISSYVTKVEGEKWTLSQEATKGIVKTAKNGNVTPFGMLDAIRHGVPGSDLYKKKFLEYSKSMFGKKQFFPSNGLLGLLGLNWRSDAELMKESEAGSYFADFTDEDVKTILRHNVRGEIIELSKDKETFEFYIALNQFLSELENKREVA